jgi:hypothetical protein
MVISGEADPFHLSARSPSTGRAPCPEKALSAVSGHSRDCDGAAAIQRIAGTGSEYPSVGSAAPGAGTSGIFFSVTTFMTLFLF